MAFQKRLKGAPLTRIISRFPVLQNKRKKTTWKRINTSKTVQAVHLCVYTPWFAYEFDLSPVGLGLYGLRLWRRWIFFSGRLTFINSGIFPELPSGGSPAVLVVVGGGGWYYCTSTTTSTTSTTTKIATEARRFPPQSARGFFPPQYDWSTSNCCSHIPLGCTLTCFLNFKCQVMKK